MGVALIVGTRCSHRLRDTSSVADPSTFWYRARFEEEPDDRLTVIIGDFVVNLRSALDHLVHEARGGGPRHRAASFPICMFDMWEVDAAGAYVVGTNRERKAFMAQLPDVPDPAVRIIKAAQPSNHDVPLGGIPLMHLLTSFANADKHGDIFVVVTGLHDPTTTFTVGPYTLEAGGSGRTAASDGVIAEFCARTDWLEEHYPDLSPAQRADLVDLMLDQHAVIDVALVGTPVVALRVPDDTDQNAETMQALPLPRVLTEMFEEVVTKIAMPLAAELGW